MYKSIMDYLCCPACKATLCLQIEDEIADDVIEGNLHCSCGKTYRIHEGVADFGSQEQDFANQWQDLSNAQNFEELDRRMDQNNPEDVLMRRKLVLDAMVAKIIAHNCKTVLDIASGRGLLLTELSKQLHNTHIISVDLSSHVLHYDRKKIKKITPNSKINFLACDATSLPLKDNIFDVATTYCGFSNMFGCALAGLKDAHRVLKSDGILVDSYVVIEKESVGYKLLKKVCVEQNMVGADTFFLHDGIRKHHENLFRAVDCNVVFEGIGIGNGMDLLPYDGEWYAEQIFVSKK